MNLTVEDRLEIEELRRLYAKATDLIGLGSTAEVAQGLNIYRQIFTEDVEIRTANAGEPLTATGPQAWADVVESALSDYVATQHLIGTQLIAQGPPEVELESYLHAWHQRADNSIWVFIGTYFDKIRKTDQGWKIYDMTLRKVAGYELPAQEQ